MADREAAAIQFAEQRLHIAQDGLAGGRIAYVSDRDSARQFRDHFLAREGIADEAHAPFGMEARAVIGDDAGCLLSAMLECVQAERRDGGGVGMAEDAEDPAFLAQPIRVGIVAVGAGIERLVAVLVHRLAFRAPARALFRP